MSNQIVLNDYIQRHYILQFTFIYIDHLNTIDDDMIRIEHIYRLVHETIEEY